MPKSTKSGSSGGSSSVSSALTGSTNSSRSMENQDGLGYHAIRNTIFAYFTFIRNRDYFRLSIALAVVQFIQLLSFGFSFSFPWGSLSNVHYFSVVRTLGTGFLKHHIHLIYFWIAVVILGLILVIGGYVLMRQRNDLECDHKLIMFSQIAHTIYIPFLYLPLMYIFGYPLDCLGNGYLSIDGSVECWGSENISVAVVGVICLGITIIIGGLTSACFYDWLPKKSSHLSMVNSRLQIMWFVTITVQALLDLFFIHSVDAEGIFFIAANAIMMLYTAYFLPFHQRFTNIIVVGCLSSSTIEAFIAYISTVAKSHGFNAIIAFVVLVLPAFFAGFVFAYFRTKHLYNATDDFQKPFLIEIGTRYIYYNDRSNDDILDSEWEAVSSMYFSGLEQFPNSTELRAAYSVLLLAKSQEYHLVFININRALRMDPRLDIQYLLFSIEKTRKKIVREKDEGAEEITEALKRTSQYQEECKKYIASFWNHLLKEMELNSITDIVVKIDKYERKAEAIYRRVSSVVIQFLTYKLMRKFPKSVTLLRAYAIFLEEVKNDLELSQIAFRSADELEEENTKRTHKKHKKDKKKKKAFEEYNPSEDVEAKPGKSTNKVTVFVEPPKEAFEEVMEPEVHDMPHVAPTPFQVIAVKNRRADILRQRTYRNKIERSRSGALKRLEFATKITLLILLADVLVVYISSEILVGSHLQSLHLLDLLQQSTSHVEYIAYHAREMQFTFQSNRPPLFNQSLSFIEDEALSDVKEIEYVVDTQLIQEMSSKEVSDYWFEPVLPQITYTRGQDGIHEILNDTINMWYMINRYIQSANFLVKYPAEVLANFTWIPEWRYIHDNRRVLGERFDDAIDIYHDLVTQTQDTFLLVLYVLLGSSIGILTALIFALFVPAIKKIKAERLDVLRIFLSIPKSAVSTLCATLENKDVKDIEDEAIIDEFGGDVNDVVNLESDKNSAPVLKKLSIRYGSSLGIIFGFVLIMFIICVVFIYKTAHIAPAIVHAGKRQASVSKMDLLHLELVLFDEATWTSREEIREQIRESMAEVLESHSALLFGNSSLGVSPSVLNNPYQYNIHYSMPCQFPEEISFGDHPTAAGGGCEGLTAILYHFLRDSKVLIKTPEEDLSFDYDIFNNLFVTTQFTDFYSWMQESTAGFVQSGTNDLEEMKRYLTIIFAVSCPVIFFSYLLMRPLERNIKEENERTMKMLLMIPFDVTDSVPAIREYLETGNVEGSHKKLEEALAENMARSKSIVDASVDAIIITNDKGIIDVFNPASEKMFGFEATDVIGLSIHTLIPDEAHENNAKLQLFFDAMNTGQRPMNGVEMVATRHGENFPIHLSLSEGHISGKSFCAAFIRDITELKQFQKALFVEKEKTDKLLTSLLPKSVASILKEDNGVDRPLIAEGYKEVTVLFADIVGFTTWASKATPRELIVTLNALFSKWDALCEKWKLEKIKTIGDCYMCAGGVPERTVDHAKNVLEFALDMHDALEDFNTENNKNIRIRIGINTGSVVAGVIGTKKFSFDLWGDAVNVASRMESSGVPDRIQVSQSTYNLCKDLYMFEERGKIEVKGKGAMIAYLLKGRIFAKTKSGREIRVQATLTPPMSVDRGPMSVERGKEAKEPQNLDLKLNLPHEITEEV